MNYGTFSRRAVIQMTWPGQLTTITGDEAGVGWTGPDNRRTFLGKGPELTEFHRYPRGSGTVLAFLMRALKPPLAENGVTAYGRFDADGQELSL